MKFFDEFQTYSENIAISKKFIKEEINVEATVLDFIKYVSKNDNVGYILEIIPVYNSGITKTNIIFVYNENYFIQEFEDISLNKISDDVLVLMMEDFIKNDFNEHKISNLVKTLIFKKREISTMESCTSGMVANLIINTEGASNILKGAYITYSNEAKVMAGVDKDLIDAFGVYSKEVAFSMADTCKKDFNANIGIGVTGTTGNVDPVNKDSIQGEIYFRIETDFGKASCKLRIDTNKLSRKEIKEIICGNIFRVLEFLET